jgi:4-amino-4-deoxy-L-arabinose transferase-like glycosyltransferase
VAFNIKMFQAYLLAPSLYLVYWASVRGKWQQKLRDVSLAIIILLLVSFSWIAIVDAIPAEHRPYVGGSRTNSAFELALGYNGLMRLLGPLQFNNWLSNTASVTEAPVTEEIGAVGLFRFFETGLANELSWLLPFVGMSLAVLALRERYRLPLRYQQAAILLWLGWLLTGIIVFSSLNFFHAYYLASIAPPLAALVGIASAKGWAWIKQSPGQGLMLALMVLGASLAYQAYALRLYQQNFDGLLAFCFLITLIFAFLGWQNSVFRRFFALAWLFSLLAVPAFWAWATANEIPNMVIPNAYEGLERPDFAALRLNFAHGDLSILSDVQYTPEARYDLLVLNQAMGADIVIASPLRVLYLGGFAGTDPIYTTEALVGMIERGEIAYVLDSFLPPELSAYVHDACTELRQLIAPQLNSITGEFSGGAILYDCIE